MKVTGLLIALLASGVLAAPEKRSLLGARRGLDSKVDRKSDSKGNGWKRKLDFKVDKDDVKIDAKSEFSDSKYSKLKDSIKFDVKANNGDGLKVDLDYKYDNSTDDAKNKYSIKYTFVVGSIIEFEPTDITKGFQEGVDAITQEIDLKDWTDMVAGSETVKGVKVDTFTTRGAKDEVFGTKGYISTETLNDMDYSSNYIKFDFDIDNFPYKGDAGKTALALKTKIKGKFKSQQKTNIVTPGGKKEISVKLENEGVDIPNSLAPVGRFSWVKTATADNVTVAVITSTKDDKKDGNREYYFTFDSFQPTTVEWDPEIGVEYPDTNAAVTLAAGNIAALLVGVSVAAFNAFGQ